MHIGRRETSKRGLGQVKIAVILKRDTGYRMYVQYRREHLSRAPSINQESIR